MSYMLAEMYGVTRQEQHENADKELEMLEKAGLYFQSDSVLGVYNTPVASLAVGDRAVRFPGHGGRSQRILPVRGGRVYEAEDYDAFLEDPADWSIRKLWPRIFTELEGLAMLPPPGLAAYGSYSLLNFGMLRDTARS